MQDKDVRALLALHRTPSLTRRSLCRLLLATASLDEVLDLNAEQLEALGIPPFQQSLFPPLVSPVVDDDFAVIAEKEITLLPINSEHYPACLKEITDPPPLLYLRGQLACLNQPQLAIVGSRRCSRGGLDNAFQFSHELASAGFVITSGMALGIDTAAHQGALAADGKTVAVLGTGVDVIYPRRNRALYEKIHSHSGAIISEFPVGTTVRPAYFPQRNRIVSGLSLGVLVVEAQQQSGSLISARLAMEQGREVFAIPGSIHAGTSQGCHQLIKQGAKLVESVADINEELKGWTHQQPQTSTDATGTPPSLTNREQVLLSMIGFDPLTIDAVHELTAWPMPELAALLTGLELKGVLDCSAGHYCRNANT